MNEKEKKKKIRHRQTVIKERTATNETNERATVTENCLIKPTKISQLSDNEEK